MQAQRISRISYNVWRIIPSNQSDKITLYDIRHTLYASRWAVFFLGHQHPALAVDVRVSKNMQLAVSATDTGAAHIHAFHHALDRLVTRFVKNLDFVAQAKVPVLGQLDAAKHVTNNVGQTGADG